MGTLIALLAVVAGVTLMINGIRGMNKNPSSKTSLSNEKHSPKLNLWRQPVKLYEIPAHYKAILAQVDEETGELLPNAVAQIDQLNEEFEHKAEYVASEYLNLTAESAKFKTEADRLAKHARSLQNNAEDLREYLFLAMTNMGMDKLTGNVRSLSVCNNSRPSIRWTGEPDDIPVYFRKIHPIELDGTIAYNEWKAGEAPLPPEMTVTIGKHLRIK